MYWKSISTNLILEYSQVGKAAEFDFVIVGSSPTTLKGWGSSSLGGMVDTVDLKFTLEISVGSSPTASKDKINLYFKRNIKLYEEKEPIQLSC